GLYIQYCSEPPDDGRSRTLLRRAETYVSELVGCFGLHDRPVKRVDFDKVALRRCLVDGESALPRRILADAHRAISEARRNTPVVRVGVGRCALRANSQQPASAPSFPRRQP